MDTALFEALADFGALGLSAGFLAWMYVKMQQRLDSMVDKFQTQIDTLNDRAEKKEAALRDRYDEVIATYNKERDHLLQGITSQMKDTANTLSNVNTRLDDLAENIAAGLSEMRQHYAVLAAERDAKRK